MQYKDEPGMLGHTSEFFRIQMATGDSQIKKGAFFGRIKAHASCRNFPGPRPYQKFLP
jgi:hypothetical protein